MTIDEYRLFLADENAQLELYEKWSHFIDDYRFFLSTGFMSVYLKGFLFDNA